MNKNHLRYIWLALSAGLFFIAGGRWNFPLAAWLGPVFAIRFFRDSSRPKRDFLLLWAVTAVAAITSWRGATSMNFIHPAVEPVFFLLTTPLGLIPYVVDRMYQRRMAPRFWLTLVYPLAATAMDFFSTSGSPFGSFGAGAYSQRDFLPVMQLASLAGLWGISFIISWFASVVNFVWENGFRRPVWIYACVLILAVGWGYGRMMFAPRPLSTPEIAGFSLANGELNELMKPLQTGDEDGFRRGANNLHARELAEIGRLAGQGADIVVLQEGAGLGYADQVEKLMADAALIAKERGIYIVLPTFTFGKEIPENKVFIIDPSGQIVLEHIKYGGNQFEGSLKGDGVLRTVDTPFGKLSAIICWDADFPEIVRQAGAAGVDLIFVPSNDWFEVRDIHSGMAAFRAVENGMAIFRQVGSGISMAADAYGRQVSRVDAYAPVSTTGFAGVQMAVVPVGAVKTVYPLAGDFLGLLSLAGLPVLLIVLWVRRKATRVTK